MDKLKKVIFPVMLILSASLLFGGMKAYAESTAYVEQELRLGTVDIELEDFGEASGILPGGTVPCRPVVRVGGYSCYLRFSLEFDAFGDYISPEGISGSWVFKESDGKWYRKEPLANGEKVRLFEGLSFDRSLPAEAQNARIRAVLKAEAVQMKNFFPDFDAEHPWRGVTAKICEGKLGYEVTEGGTASAVFRVTYSGGAEDLVADPDAFASGLPVLMPGDSFSRTALLKNNGADPVNLYFYSETDPSDPLLNEAALTIATAAGGILYEGPLSADSLNGSGRSVPISSLGPGDGDSMTFSVRVPDHLGNGYALKKSSVRWFFTAVPEHGGTHIGSPAPVKTGDANRPAFFMILAGLALLILSTGVYMTGSKRKGSK